MAARCARLFNVARSISGLGDGAADVDVAEAATVGEWGVATGERFWQAVNPEVVSSTNPSWTNRRMFPPPITGRCTVPHRSGCALRQKCAPPSWRSTSLDSGRSR
jgi:hypothetical protein